MVESLGRVRAACSVHLGSRRERSWKLVVVGFAGCSPLSMHLRLGLRLGFSTFTSSSFSPSILPDPLSLPPPVPPLSPPFTTSTRQRRVVSSSVSASARPFPFSMERRVALSRPPRPARARNVPDASGQLPVESWNAARFDGDVIYLAEFRGGPVPLLS